MAECQLSLLAVAPHIGLLDGFDFAACSLIGLRGKPAWAGPCLPPPARKLPSPASLSLCLPALVEHRCPNSQSSSAPPLITCSTYPTQSTTTRTNSHTPQINLHNHHVGLRADQGRQELRSRTVSLPTYHHNHHHRKPHLLACLLYCLLYSAPILSCCPPHLTLLSIFYTWQPTPPIYTMVTRPTATTANAMDTRTPQNTPAQNAPISSRAQAPSVSDIKEGWSSPTVIEPRTGQPADCIHRHRGP